MLYLYRSTHLLKLVIDSVDNSFEIIVRVVIGLVPDNFLLVADSREHGIFQIDMSTGSAWKIPLSHQSNPIAVAYDPLDSKIYWTDVKDKVIKIASLNGTAEEVFISLHQRTYAIAIRNHSF